MGGGRGVGRQARVLCMSAFGFLPLERDLGGGVMVATVDFPEGPAPLGLCYQ